MTFALCAAAGHQGCLELLLDAGADINQQNRRGYTPLFVAVNGGHFFALRFLLRKGAAGHCCKPTGVGLTLSLFFVCVTSTCNRLRMLYMSERQARKLHIDAALCIRSTAVKLACKTKTESLHASSPCWKTRQLFQESVCFR